jgi:hypothetical protein
MNRTNNNEPPPLSWEIGATSHRSLSLIRKSLTTAGWKDIAVYCDDIWLTVRLNASFCRATPASGQAVASGRLDRRNRDVQYCS